mgnify:CR=1 FL=1
MILHSNPHINILNTRVNLINIDQLHSNISNYIINKQKVTIGNLNINAANIAYSNPWYAEYLANCPIIFCDGKGIQLAAALLGEKIPPHITYHTWIWELLNFSNNSDFSIFFLGSRNSVIENAITTVKQKIPSINVMGHHGFFNKSNKENDDVINMINLFNPDIIIVGFGMPLQEKWIKDNIFNDNISNLSSSELIKWADLGIIFGSSMGFQMLEERVGLIFPTYLDKNSTIYEENNVAIVVDSLKEMIDFMVEYPSKNNMPNELTISNFRNKYIYNNMTYNEIMDAYCYFV